MYDTIIIAYPGAFCHLNGIFTLEICLKWFPFYQAAISHPKHIFLALLGIGHLPQFIDANVIVGSGFLQRKIGFLPNRNFVRQKADRTAAFRPASKPGTQYHPR